MVLVQRTEFAVVKTNSRPSSEIDIKEIILLFEGLESNFRSFRTLR